MGASKSRPVGEHGQETKETGTSLMPAADARRIVDESVMRYFDKRREGTPAFIDRHFSWGGAWKLNSRAFGPDIYRAPLNVALLGPALGAKLAAKGLDKLGQDERAEALRKIRFHFKTDVNEQLEWLIHTDLLEIPYAQGPRSTQRDALAEEIFTHPEMNEALSKAVNAAVDAAGPKNRDELERLLFAYMETRAANAEVVNLAVCLLAGGLIAHQVTPGALSLAPSLSSTLAHSSAVSSFPLGSGLGSAWYSAFPVAPSAALAVGSTAGVLAIASLVTAFSGLISDPVQRSLGLHERRLLLFLDTLEQNVLFDETNHLKVRDHYVGRIIDLFDALAAVWSFAR